MPKPRKIALVLGMHRSGTSALAGLIARLGYNVGQTLLPANEYNPKGYYENEKLVGFHTDALTFLGSSWHDLRILPASAFRPAWIADAAQQLASILKAEYGNARAIMVKDPRACRLLPVWQRFALETGADLRIILIGRQPLQVSYSLAHRDQFSRNKSLLLWLQYNLLAERQTREQKRLIVRYQDLLTAPGAKLKELSKFLGKRLRVPLKEVLSAIDPSVSRHSTEEEALSENPELNRWVQEVWQILFLGHRVNRPEEQKLDRIFNKLQRQLSFLPKEASGNGDYEAAYLQRAMVRKEEELKALKGRFQEQNQSLRDVMRQRDEVCKKAETVATTISTKEGELISLKERYKERTATLEAVMLHRDEARKQVEVSVTALAAKDKELMSLKDQHTKRAATLERVILERDEARRELVSLKDRYRERTATLEAVMLHRDEARKQVEASIAALAAKDKELIFLKDRHTERTATLERIMSERDEARKQMEAVVTALAVRDKELIFLRDRNTERTATLERVMSERDETRKQVAATIAAKEKEYRELEAKACAEAEELARLREEWESTGKQLQSFEEERRVSEKIAAAAAAKIVDRESAWEQVHGELEILRRDWTALPLRRRLKKLAGFNLVSAEPLRLNAVNPSVWNRKVDNFSFSVALFPNLDQPDNFFLEGWLLPEGPGAPLPSFRLVNEAGERRGGAKRKRERKDVSLLFEKDARTLQCGFAFLDFRGFEKCRLEARRSSGNWVPLVLIDFKGVGWQHLRDIHEITASRLFDCGWYARRYDLTELSHASLISHYLREGAVRGLWPNPLFDTPYYYESNREILATGQNPLLAYLEAAKEGKCRQPNPWFEPVWYLAKNKDIAGTGLDPLAHYLKYGKRRKSSPGPSFDVAAYLGRNPDVEQSTLDPLAHFIHYGSAEGRRFPRPGDTINWIYEVEPTGDRTNVLLVGHVLGNKMFGSERSLLELIQLIDRERFNIYCSFPQSEASFIDRIKPFVTGVAIFPYRWWSGVSTDNDGYDCDFEEVMRSRRIGLVHVNSIVLRDPLIAAKRLKIPSVLHLREIITRDPDLAARIGLPAEEIVAQVAARSEFVVANSHFTQSEHGNSERAFVLYNTADEVALDMPLRQRHGHLRVGMLSSNLPKKGLEGFFALARAARDREEPIEFWLVGPETEWVTQHFQENGGCPPNVRCTGYVAKPREALAEVDVVINLSTFAESFGRSVGEGMLARRPAVVYEYGALPELVRDGIDGFVVPFRDVDAALDRLSRLAREPELVAQMGEAARTRAVEMFSREVGARTLRSIYDSILSEAASRHDLGTQIELEQKALPISQSRRALRIGYFLWHFPVPSETFVLNELRYLVQRGYDVRVFCRQSPYEEFKPDFPITWEQVNSVDDLAEKLALSERHVVHSHFVFPTVTKFLWPACEAAGIPFTFIAHAQDIFRHANAEQNRLGDVATSPWCRAVFAPGSFHQRLFIEQGVPPEKIVINPQSIPLDFFRRPGGHELRTSGKRTICAIHRFVEKKGLEHAIRAAVQLAKFDISLYLYGYGPLEESLRQLANELELANVHFPGPLNERAAVVQALHEHDLFLAPSLRAADGDMDGVPTVLMEAMACGTPVVASRISSLPDLVQEGVTGYLCDPDNTESLLDAILRFYNDPVSKVETIARRAREMVENYYDIEKATRTLERVWAGEGIDIVLVTHNNLPELQEVVNRIFRFTTNPFQLCIVDNESDEETRTYLNALAASHSNVELELLDENIFVGPGTNRGVELGRNQTVVYLCSKEGFALHRGWDQKVMDYLETHPTVGLAGTLAHSPSYLLGRDYEQSLERFPKFRNREFARLNPDRTFAHVQGGVIVIRRAMFEEIGGFSREVPHQHTDVEYSYYVESCGWELGDISGVAAYYVKTLPPMTAHLTERVEVLHPGSLAIASVLDQVATRETEFCNVCARGVAFTQGAEGLLCPNCSATPFHRSLYRYIAESILPYRRLPALYISSFSGLSPIWERMFQGRCLTYADALTEVDRVGKLELATAGRDIVVLEVPGSIGKPDERLMNEARRIVKLDGTLVFGQAYGMGSLLYPTESGSFETTGEVKDFLGSFGFSVKEMLNYASGAVRYLDRDIFECRPIG